jgi:hypothetical protein
MKIATEIVHWPGKDTFACEEHALKLKEIGKLMGFNVSSTPWPAGETRTNCENEEKKKEAR